MRTADTFTFDSPSAALFTGLLVPITDGERLAFSAGNPGWFNKELIREGVYIHPLFGWKMTVAEADIRQWVSAFQKMSANGLEVPVPDGHVWTTADNKGFARELYAAENEDGGLSLYGWLEVLNRRAAEGIRDGTTNHVSVAVGREVKDGLGNEYGSAIEHVALTNYPVAHNAGPFAEAAFAGGENHAVALFSAEAPEMFEGPVVSVRPWSEVDASKIPASGFLIVGDPEDSSTWSLPVHEGSGPIREGRHISRGSLNAHAVEAAAAELLARAKEFDPSVRRTAAQKLLGLYRQITKEPPEDLGAIVRREASAKPAGTAEKRKPMDKKLLALCKRLGIDVADPKAEPTAEFLAKVWEAAEKAAGERETFSTQVTTITAERDALKKAAGESEAERTKRLEKKAESDADFRAVYEAQKATDARLAKVEAERQEDAIREAEATVEAACERGALKEEGAKAFRDLLSVRMNATGFRFSKEDTAKVEAVQVDVAKTVTALVKSLPDHASLDMGERAARTGGSRTLHVVESTKEEKDAQAEADKVATENLMGMGQEVPAWLLGRLKDGDLKKDAEAHNRGIRGNGTDG